MTVVHIV